MNKRIKPTVNKSLFYAKAKLEAIIELQEEENIKKLAELFLSFKELAQRKE